MSLDKPNNLLLNPESFPLLHPIVLEWELYRQTEYLFEWHFANLVGFGILDQIIQKNNKMWIILWRCSRFWISVVQMPKQWTYFKCLCACVWGVASIRFDKHSYIVTTNLSVSTGTATTWQTWQWRRWSLPPSLQTFTTSSQLCQLDMKPMWDQW